MKILVLLLVALSVAALFAERQPFERYKSIVDRQMFGDPPEGFDPTKSPSEVQSASSRRQQKELTKEQEQVKSAVHLSMINVTPDGNVMVGFTDKSDAKTPHHYYLRIGETRDGWVVKEADPVAKNMTIERDGIEVFLELGGDSASGKGGETKRANGRGGQNPGDRRSSLASSGSLRGRRRAAEEAREKEIKMRMDSYFAEKQKELDKREEAANADRAAREEERAAQDAERKEQKRQLLDMAAQLKKAREEKKAKEAESNAQSESQEGGEDS